MQQPYSEDHEQQEFYFFGKRQPFEILLYLKDESNGTCLGQEDGLVHLHSQVPVGHPSFLP